MNCSIQSLYSYGKGMGSTLSRILTPSLSSFTYQPLQHPGSNIRLLSLTHLSEPKAASVDQDIHCELSTWDFVDDRALPSYIAISYTWGDAANERGIIVNGQRLYVHYNCWYVLHQARLHGFYGQHLWIDAICINQEDLKEKSWQVGLMGSIYAHAREINVSLGEHENNSALLFHWIDEYSMHASQIPRPVEQSGMPCTEMDYLRDKLLQVETSRWFQKMSRESYGDFNRIVVAHKAVSNRPYFNRIWIVQELLWSRAANFLCGDTRVSLNDFRTFHLAFNWYCLKYREDLFSESSRYMERLFQMHYIWSHHLWSRDIVELVSSFSQSKCMDRRDKVFALLSLAEWHGRVPIKADYTKTAPEVALEVLSYMCPPYDEDDSVPLRLGIYHSQPISAAREVLNALRIQPQEEEMAALLSSRLMNARNRHEEAGHSPCIKKDWNFRGYIEIQEETYCELFENGQNRSDLTACLIGDNYSQRTNDEPIEDTVFREALTSTTITKRRVFGQKNVMAIVCPNAQAGDFLLPMYQRDTRSGIVLRRLDGCPANFSIVGQALFGPKVTICPGETQCQCELNENMHQNPDVCLEAHFDPEDLLLFVLQGLPKSLHVDDNHMYTELDYATIQHRLETSVTKPDDPHSSYGVQKENYMKESHHHSFLSKSEINLPSLHRKVIRQRRRTLSPVRPSPFDDFM